MGPQAPRPAEQSEQRLEVEGVWNGGIRFVDESKFTAANV